MATVTVRLVNDQCWMASNLMTTKYPDDFQHCSGTQLPLGMALTMGNYAYPPNSDNTAEESLANIRSDKARICYQWSAAMNGTTTAGTQGICPAAGHSDGQSAVYILENYLKDNGADLRCSAEWDLGLCNGRTKLQAGGTSG